MFVFWAEQLRSKIMKAIFVREQLYFWQLSIASRGKLYVNSRCFRNSQTWRSIIHSEYVICVIFILSLALPLSRHDNSLHVVFSLVSGITPDLQVDRRGSTVEIYPPTCVTPRSNHNGLDKTSRDPGDAQSGGRVARENKSLGFV